MMRPILILLLTQIPPATPDLQVVVAPAETLSVSVSGQGDPVVVVPGLLGGSYGFRKVVALLNETAFAPTSSSGSARVSPRNPATRIIRWRRKPPALPRSWTRWAWCAPSSWVTRSVARSRRGWPRIGPTWWTRSSCSRDVERYGLIEQVGFSPFYSRAYDRLVLAELLRQAGRLEEALGWYRSLTEGYEVLFVAPAHYRMAGIFQDMGGSDSAATYHRGLYERIWQSADSTLVRGLGAARW